MKRINLTQWKVIVALTASILTGSAHAVTIYLQNNYGATIKFKLAKPDDIVSSLFEYTAVNQQRVWVQPSLGADKGTVPNNLSIRTTGIGSSYVSYYYDLGYILSQIKNEENSHPNQNAIINVSYTRGLFGTSWDITLDWQKKVS